jgi:hypothetical protein
MNALPQAPYIELHVPNAATEQEFLQFAVQAAVKKYRELHVRITPPQAPFSEGNVFPSSIG